jgi:hypothetical protein
MPGEDLHLSVMAPLQAHFAWPAGGPAGPDEDSRDPDSKPNYRRSRLESGSRGSSCRAKRGNANTHQCDKRLCQM